MVLSNSWNFFPSTETEHILSKFKIESHTISHITLHNAHNYITVYSFSPVSLLTFIMSILTHHISFILNHPSRTLYHTLHTIYHATHILYHTTSHSLSPISHENGIGYSLSTWRYGILHMFGLFLEF